MKSHWEGKVCADCGKQANVWIATGYFCREHGRIRIKELEAKRYERNRR